MYLSSPKHRGFTLLELLVVLILVAITVSMALPSFLSAIRRSEVRSAALQLASVINYARVEAIRQGEIAYIVPTYFRKNGKFDDPEKYSWQKANGLLAFIDNMGNDFRGTAHYNKDEEIRSTQIKNSIAMVAEVAPLSNLNQFTTNEIGLLIYPNGEMKYTSNYRFTSKGNSGYIVRITLKDKRVPTDYHCLWIDTLARAHSCPSALKAADVSDIEKQICSCGPVTK